MKTPLHSCFAALAFLGLSLATLPAQQASDACRLTPRDALRFARGEQVMASSGQPAKLSRPLDFLVVADHSDNMGFFTDLFAGKPELLADTTGRKWYDMIQAGQGGAAAMEIIGTFSQGKFPKALVYLPGTRAYR